MTDSVGQNVRLGVVLLGLNILVSVAAHLILKAGMDQIDVNQPTLSMEYALLFLSPLIVGGLALYGSGTLLWLFCLRHLDLSLAYPLGTLQYAFIFFGAWFFFDENLSLLRITGTAIIVLGVIVIAASRTEST